MVVPKQVPWGLGRLVQSRAPKSDLNAENSRLREDRRSEVLVAGSCDGLANTCVPD